MQKLIIFQYIGITAVILVIITIVMQVAWATHIGTIVEKLNYLRMKSAQSITDDQKDQALDTIVARFNAMRSTTWRVTGIMFGILVLLAIINEIS